MFTKRKVKNSKRKLNSKYSEIVITISGKGNKTILYKNFMPLPDEIIVNDLPVSISKYQTLST